MAAVRFLLAILVVGSVLRADTSALREAPFYSGSSIVNAADNQPGPLAPNAIATIYGTGLAYTTKAIAAQDIHGGLLQERFGEVPKDRQVAVICGTGYRASIAASFLKSRGYHDVANVLGGMSAWQGTGLVIAS